MRNLAAVHKKRETEQHGSIISGRASSGHAHASEISLSLEISNPGRKKPVFNKRRALEAILGQISKTATFRDRSDLSSFVNWKGNAEAPIHRWLRYREAYSPHLITKLALGRRILDPFCGCGSIMIGSAENG